MKRPDALIFDMDGTLWDAVDSYATVWNTTFNDLGLSCRVTREELVGCMGMKLDAILERLISASGIDRKEFMSRLSVNEQELMPRLCGRLYPGVAEGMRHLSEEYPLYMVSNCSASGIPNFLRCSGLESCVSDHLANGDNGLDKDRNIAILMELHHLKSPLYIGDTQGDADLCKRAGVDFLHVTWGFGSCRNPKWQVDSFDNLVKMLTT